MNAIAKEAKLVSFKIDSGEWEEFMRASAEEGLSASSNLRLLVKRYLKRKRRERDEKRNEGAHRKSQERA